MKLIAGLGNPGPRYAASRHNIGYLVVDALARRWGTEVARLEARFDGQLGRVPRAGEEVLLLKPTTFMNLSGRSVAAVVRFYKLGAGDVLVIHDDLDLEVGQLRIRASGSAGGHKGLMDVCRQLSTLDVARLRLGIGKVHPDATVDYVLGRFRPEEGPLIAAAIEAAADAAECWVREGIAAAMNKYNRRRGGQAPAEGD